jgi:hypothetical protein
MNNMIHFKFFGDNNGGDMPTPIDELIDYEEYNGASWHYGGRENLGQYQCEIVVEEHNGIHSFLNHFPPGFVVTILSITGPDGRFHDSDTEYEDGWGFDITSDLIRIEWVRYTH